MDDRVFRGAVIAALVIGGLFVLRMRFGYALETPAPPQAAEMFVEQTPVEDDAPALEETEFQKQLRRDSRKYDIRPAATRAAMGRVFRYKQDLEKRSLVPGASPMKVLGLKISAKLKDLPNTKFQQFEVTIENTRSRAVAYRVRTRPSVNPKVCFRKQDLAHNAVALAPKGSVTRAECVWRDGWSMDILSVEVIDLNSLGFHYVSSVPPARLGVDARTGRGHRPDEERARLCNVVHSVPVQRAMEHGAVTWRDLIDFFARHRCETYAFPVTYKAFTKDAEYELPFVE